MNCRAPRLREGLAPPAPSTRDSRVPLRVCVIATEHLRKRRIKQLRIQRPADGLRATTTRDEEVYRLRTVFPSHVPCELERDECTHAMAEKGERFIQVWSESLTCHLNQLVYFGARRFGDAQASSGQLNRTDFNRVRKTLLPQTKDRISAACIGETEDTHTGFSIRLPVNKPRRPDGHKWVHCWMRSVPPAVAGGWISVRTHPLPRVVLTSSKYGNRSITKPVTKLGPNLARLNPMNSSQQRTVVEQVAAARHVQEINRHRPILAEPFPTT